MSDEMNSRVTKSSLRWFANLTEKEREGIKNKFENTLGKKIEELTIKDIYNIYMAFFGMQ